MLIFPCIPPVTGSPTGKSWMNSIPTRFAPTASAIIIPSPVALTLLVEPSFSRPPQWVSYFFTISLLRAKPPVAITTPLLALTITSLFPCFALTPTTLSFSTISSVAAVFNIISALLPFVLIYSMYASIGPVTNGFTNWWVLCQRAPVTVATSSRKSTPKLSNQPIDSSAPLVSVSINSRLPTWSPPLNACRAWSWGESNTYVFPLDLYSSICAANSSIILLWVSLAGSCLVYDSNSVINSGRISYACWRTSSTALYCPPAIIVEPPTLGIFSKTITVASFCNADTAAASPAPPPPITTTSADLFIVSPGSDEVSTSFINSSIFAPEPAKAFFTASSIPLLEYVAPDTVSTLRLWYLTILSGIFIIALSEIPGDSLCSKTFTSKILFASTFTSTLIGPLSPFASPVYVPGVKIPFSSGVTGVPVGVCFEHAVAEIIIKTANNIANILLLNFNILSSCIIQNILIEYSVDIFYYIVN